VQEPKVIPVSFAISATGQRFVIPPNLAYMPAPGQNYPFPGQWLRMLWRVSRPIRSRSKPPGFIPPCQPALADSPPLAPARCAKSSGHF
jgi:hypothetical protein